MHPWHDIEVVKDQVAVPQRDRSGDFLTSGSFVESRGLS